MRENEGLESGYKEERMCRIYLYLHKESWKNVGIYDCFQVSDVDLIIQEGLWV